MGLTAELAEFIHDRKVDSPSAITEAQRGFFDWLGCLFAGADEPAAQIAARVVGEESAAGPAACLVGDLGRRSATGAALVNGTASHALDLDDIGLGIGHPTAAIGPAALAAAEMVGASGRELLDALVMGYEVAHRFAALPPVTLGGPYARGYHGTSLYGIFGAVTAASRLFGLTREAIGNALAIAATESSGLRVNFGTMTKPYHAGSAASSGLRSALLARHGFSGSPVAIEGAYGWFNVIGNSGELAHLTQDLDAPFAVERGLWFKKYPCCGANHNAIDSVLTIRREHDLAPEDIARVDATVHQTFLEEVLVYPWPTSGLEGKFCLAYNVAAAAQWGRVSVDTFSEEAVSALTPFRDKVAVHSRTDIPLRTAFVTLTTTDGRTFECVTGDGSAPEIEDRVLHGMASNPLSWDELSTKFRENTSACLAAEVTSDLVRVLTDLPSQADVRNVTELALSGLSSSSG